MARIPWGRPSHPARAVEDGAAPFGFGHFVEEQSGNAAGDGADDEEPQELGILLQFVVFGAADSEALGDDLHPVGGEVDEDGEEGADVEGDIEVECLGIPAEQPGGEVEVCRAADGQEFGESLDDGQDNDLRQWHKSSGCGKGRGDVKGQCADMNVTGECRQAVYSGNGLSRNAVDWLTWAGIGSSSIRRSVCEGNH